MLKKISFLFAFVILLGLAYLTLWPVPINPVAWNAPKNAGYTDDFTPNMKLASLKTLAIGEHHGPEDVAGRVEDDRMVIYTSTQSGDIIRIDPLTNEHSVFANTGGVALGLQFAPDGILGGNLIVADAHKGLLSIDASGTVTVLTDKTDEGSPILFADELAIAADGKIYFSDASTKFGAKMAGSTLSGSLLELMEHGSTGRVLVYDPADGSTKTVADNMSFPNGVAMCPDDACILIVETGTYSVKRFWLTGLKAGIMDTVIDNLPGFPDNINKGQDGRYWIGLTSPRSEALDNLSAKPFMRKLVQRLPAALRPKAVNYGFIFAVDMNGKVLVQYQDPSGSYPLTSGATEPGDGWLYIGSLGAIELGRKDLRGETFVQP
ncbi:SMP-30/gluconolactonase/LRE family protein [bacterium AH-315-J23]|nr:SMP-30/gluconolactonase/LRE family protein [bacterium AH-315-J23]